MKKIIVAGGITCLAGVFAYAIMGKDAPPQPENPKQSDNVFYSAIGNLDLFDASGKKLTTVGAGSCVFFKPPVKQKDDRTELQVRLYGLGDDGRGFGTVWAGTTRLNPLTSVTTIKACDIKLPEPYDPPKARDNAAAGLSAPQKAIGIQIRHVGAWGVIDGIVPAGPAQKAGLKVGDMLLSVDGKPVNGKSVEQMLEMIRGNGRDDVTLQYRVDSVGRDVTVKIDKDIISPDAALLKTREKDAPVLAVIGDFINMHYTNAGRQVNVLSGANKDAKPLLRADWDSCFLVYDKGGTADFAKVKLRTDNNRVVDGFIPRKDVHEKSLAQGQECLTRMMRIK